MTRRSNSSGEEKVTRFIAAVVLSTDANGRHCDDPTSDLVKREAPCLTGVYNGVLALQKLALYKHLILICNSRCLSSEFDM